MTTVRKYPRAKPYRRTVVEIKALVRYRDGYCCQNCGMTAQEHFRRFKQSLDVHRLVPGSRYTVKGCTTLCRKCHGPQPRSRRREGYYGGPIYIRLHEDVADMAERLAALQSPPQSTPDFLSQFLRLLLKKELTKALDRARRELAGEEEER